MKILTSNSDVQQTLLSLGQNFVLDIEAFQPLEAVVCALYGYSGNDVNAARYALFCAKASDSSQLPPTHDALLLHIRRCNYQTAIWRRALVPCPQVLGPNNHGWSVEDGSVNIMWMTQPPAPPDVLKLISCRCSTGCTSQRCSCVRANLPSTDACKCLL